MRKVIVTTDRVGAENLARLAGYAEVVEGWKLKEAEIPGVLPQVDAALVLGWPTYFTPENLAAMKRLKFIQTMSVGVNQVRFQDLPAGVKVSSNAGAYSTEVAEHAWGLLLDSAKRIAVANAAIREGGQTIDDFRADLKDVVVLKGKTLGIVGYGGIGRAVAKFAVSFGMKVLAFGRGAAKERGTKVYHGKAGLDGVLRLSDALLIAVPLTKSTERMIGARELSLMKKSALLVNVARGDIVDQKALHDHLVTHPSFRYATDVWWSKEGRETLETEKPFGNLPNFVGTPHTSGPAAVVGGEPQASAVTNTIRYLRGLRPKNVVDPTEYPSRL